MVHSPTIQTQRLRTRQAALYVGVAPRTLEKLRLRGGGPPFFKVGRAVVYDTCDLDRWLDGKRRRSTSDPGPREAG